MRILLVNHFTPPDESPTARLLVELGDGLSGRGWSVSYLGAAQGYRQQKKVRGWRRWLRDIRAHASIFFRGFSGQKPDWILCLSDPPGLVFTVALLARLRGARLAHWAMDVYPEIATALGEIQEGLLSSLVSKAMHHGYRQTSLLVALDEDMSEVLKKAGGGRPYVLPPWPPLLVARSSLETSTTSPATIRWLYSGNLGRAHDYTTLLEAQKLLEDKGLNFELVFQGGGPGLPAAQTRASSMGLRQCLWLDYADPQDLLPSLLQAHVLVATQRSETKGLLWPSKLALISLLPRPIVWVGPKNGATAQFIEQRAIPSTAVGCGEAQALAVWLQTHAEVFLGLSQAKVDLDVINDHARDQYHQSIVWWHQHLAL